MTDNTVNNRIQTDVIERMEPADAPEVVFRRTRSNLRMLGFGVVAFVLWNFVKGYLVTFLAPEQAVSMDTPVTDPGAIQASEDAVQVLETGPKAILIVLIAFGVVMMLLDTFFRYKAGRAAMAEASGKQKGWGYVILGILVLVFEVFIFIASIYLNFKYKVDLHLTMPEIATTMVDITSLTILGEMVLTAIKFKGLKGTIPPEELIDYDYKVQPTRREKRAAKRLAKRQAAQARVAMIQSADGQTGQDPAAADNK